MNHSTHKPESAPQLELYTNKIRPTSLISTTAPIRTTHSTLHYQPPLLPPSKAISAELSWSFQTIESALKSTTSSRCNSSVQLHHTQSQSQFQFQTNDEPEKLIIHGHEISAKDEDILKNALLQLLIEHEINYFRESPSLYRLQGTKFLRFMYTIFLVQFPFFANQKKEFWSSVEELCLMMPKLSSSLERNKESSRDKMWKRISRGVAFFFQSTIRIKRASQIPKEPRTVYLNDPSNPGLNKENQRLKAEAELDDQMNEFWSMLDSFLENFVEEGQFRQLFYTLKANPTCETLPEMYQKLLRYGCRLLSVSIQRRLDEDTNKKLKSFHSMIPIITLRTILTLTNPAMVIQNLISLFMSKIFLGNNLIQRIYSVIAKLNKTKEALKQIRLLVVNPNIKAKIANYVQLLYDGLDIPDYSKDEPILKVWKIITNLSIDPVLTPHEVQVLQARDYMTIHELLEVETRMRDKEAIYHLLGNSDLMRVVKVVMPAFSEPLAQIFATANMPSFVSQVYDFLGRATKIADSNTASNGADQLREYEAAVETLKDQLYSFMHRATVHDKGSLQSILNWFMARLAFAKRGSDPPMELKQLISGLDLLEFDGLRNELNELASYLAAKRARKEKTLREMIVDTPSCSDLCHDHAGNHNTSGDLNNNNNNHNNSNNNTKGGKEKIKPPPLNIVPKLINGFVPLVRQSLFKQGLFYVFLQYTPKPPIELRPPVISTSEASLFQHVGSVEPDDSEDGSYNRRKTMHL